MNFSAVILAGGQSSRMGRDKAFLEIDGQTWLARQIALVRNLGTNEIFISGRIDQDYSLFELPVLRDQFSNSGPLAGIHAALSAASNPLLLVLAVDLPKTPSHFLQNLLNQCRDGYGAIPRTNRHIEPLAAFYPKEALSLAETMLLHGEKAAGKFAERCVTKKMAGFSPCDLTEQNFLANWNEPADIGAI